MSMVIDPPAAAPPWPDEALWSDADLVEACRAVEARRRADLAQHVRLLIEVERRKAYVADGHRDLAGFGRCEHRWSDHDARAHRDLERLCRLCPQVLDRLAVGRLGTAQGFLLARLARAPRVGQYVVEQIDDFLDHAAQMTYAEFEQHLRAWRSLVDEDGPDPDRAHRQRHASYGQVGSAWRFLLEGPSADLAQLRAALARFEDIEFERDRAAVIEEHGDDEGHRFPRTAAQRRYDAFQNLLRHTAAPTADDEGSGGAATIVNIVVDGESFLHGLERLLGLGGPRPVRSPFGPGRAFCHTFDGDPIGLRDAVVAALAGRVRILLRGADGLPAAMSSSSRLFTGALRDAVLSTATQCTHPGCTVRATRCQIDHLLPVHRGGVTSVHNGAPGCGHHNRWRYASGVTVVRLADGTIATYRPDGRRLARPD